MSRAEHDIKIDLDAHEWVADATYNDETKRWDISISEDGKAYYSNNIDYATREEALRAALGYILMDAGNPVRVFIAVRGAAQADAIHEAEYETGMVSWYYQGHLADDNGVIWTQYYTDCLSKSDAAAIQRYASSRDWLTRLAGDDFGFRRVD